MACSLAEGKDGQEPLARYIREAVAGAAERKNRQDWPFFAGGPTGDGPLLHQGGRNHILVYSGSFNPPHKGHVRLLEAAWRYVPADINLVAALVVPRSDEDIEDKILDRRTEDPRERLILTASERAEQFRGERLSSWMWVHEDAENAEKMLNNVIQLASRDGFSIRLVHVAGPDIIDDLRDESDDQPDEEDAPDQVDLLMVADVSRPPSWVKDDGNLRSIGGCGEWESMPSMKDSDDNDVDILQCKHMSGMAVRFVMTGCTEPRILSLSSTKVRDTIYRIIDRIKDQEGIEQLLRQRGLVPHPNVLAKHLAKGMLDGRF